MLQEINRKRKELNAYFIGIQTSEGNILSDGKRIWFSTSKGYYFSFRKTNPNTIVKILEAAKNNGWKWERMAFLCSEKNPPKISF